MQEAHGTQSWLNGCSGSPAKASISDTMSFFWAPAGSRSEKSYMLEIKQVLYPVHTSEISKLNGLEMRLRIIVCGRHFMHGRVHCNARRFSEILLSKPPILRAFSPNFARQLDIFRLYGHLSHKKPPLGMCVL